MRSILAVSCLAAVGLAWGAQPASAQGAASVNAIVRVVKTAAPGSTSFGDARIGSRVDAGGRVRTGGRSKAGMVFANKSTLSLDELTEVIVAGAQQTDVRLLGGRILGNFTRPGTVSGGNATAAVRGTKFIFFENVKQGTAYVRCYSDSVYVGPPGVQMRAGAAELTSPTTLVDPNLVGDESEWVGKSVRVMRGPNKGETRQVTDFDPETGTLTLDQPIADGDKGAAKLRQDRGDGAIEYLLTSDAEADVIRLTEGEGVTVRDGRVSASYPIAPLDFAEGQRDPWYRELKSGLAIRTFPGTDTANALQNELFPTQDQIQDVSGDLNPGDLNELLGEKGDLIIVIPGEGSTDRFGAQRVGTLLSPVAAAAGAGVAPLALGSASGAAAAYGASRGKLGLQSLEELQEEEYSLGEVGQPEANPGKGIWFRADPFGVFGSGGNSEGFRLRAQSVVKNVYLEAGTRIANLNGNFVSQLSEGYGVFRARSFDMIAGRYHPYLGPANNANLGTLLGFNTFDAAVVRTHLPGRYQQRAGYIWNSSPLQGQPYRGVFARGEYSVLEGQVGWQLLNITNPMLPANVLIPATQTGWQIDGSIPVVRNQLDAYSQMGFDNFNNFTAMGGVYLPGVFQSAKLDVFAEYHHRDGFNDFTNLWLRREFGKNLWLIAFAQKQLDGPFDGGGAFQYTVLLR
jgi:hypothetical protein